MDMRNPRVFIIGNISSGETGKRILISMVKSLIDPCKLILSILKKKFVMFCRFPKFLGEVLSITQLTILSSTIAGCSFVVNNSRSETWFRQVAYASISVWTFRILVYPTTLSPRRGSSGEKDARIRSSAAE